MEKTSISITGCHGHKVDQTTTIIDGSYTRTATTRLTAQREQVSRSRSRKLLHCSLLEPCAGITGSHGSEGRGLWRHGPLTR